MQPQDAPDKPANYDCFDDRNEYDKLYRIVYPWKQRVEFSTPAPIECTEGCIEDVDDGEED